ncbi:glycoside hydrolase family 2 TIM barrel-domain containing protein [Algibacter sp. 2305UL17-15]|uniref:glycoside hydrolase family 2 TIM barrel-domain containing protein n=1 Tax=Algibacter sp. 2305UL17-15 TaxID=3231268 RepID=UPI00345A877E
MNKNKLHYLFLFIFSICSVSSSNAQTTLQKTNNNWELLVNGKPFEIKGATFGYDNDVPNYDTYFKDLNFLGVNSIRTWATDENSQQLLDTAHKYNIKVMVGIWMRHGRPGMEDDDSFNYLEDKKGMEAMYTNAINTVEKYKNHPAVLTWGIGNEVYLNMATDEEKTAYSKLLERICSEIKKRDKNHPITSVEAWTFGLEWWQKYVPSIDIYGLNSYGAGAGVLASELEKRAIDKPYIITEFGVTGEWDIKAEKNGIKIEPSDQQKYDAIAKGYHDWIVTKPANLGAYVFHYANGNDFIAPWLFTHYSKMYRPQYWAIRAAYTGQKPVNNVPVIETFQLPDTTTKNGSWIPVNLKVSDIENEKLDISFHYNQRTGSRKRRDQINPLNFRGDMANGFEIEIPNEDGAIKVYVNAKDTYKNVGIASTSIVVNNKEGARKYLVPKVSLPFYVYKDGIENPYAPSAYMGNIESISVDMHHKYGVHSGKASLKIAYNLEHDWYGLGLVDPANDWGEILGGYDLTGATKFSFWAKASKKNVTATIGFGLIGKDKPFPDTAKKSIEVKLGTTWKKYSIKLKKLDLSCIRSGLVVFSSSYGSPQDIYLDDVIFE